MAAKVASALAWCGCPCWFDAARCRDFVTGRSLRHVGGPVVLNVAKFKFHVCELEMTAKV